MKKRNILFIIVCIIGGAFILTPLLLRIPFVYNVISWFLFALGNSVYKSSYIETFGAILGTFLAISGALWTQRKIDEVSNTKELQESALVVYYDFRFAFDDIVKFMQLYLSTQGKLSNIIEDINEYRKKKKRYRIYIDDNWIHNVAKLSHSLTSNEIQTIYKLYGDLNTIKKVFNSTESSISVAEEQAAYSIMYSDICCETATLTNPISIKVSLKDEIELILNKLKEKSGISNIT